LPGGLATSAPIEGKLGVLGVTMSIAQVGHLHRYGALA